MKLEISDECSAIIDNFGYQYSSRNDLASVALDIKNPEYNGFVIFAVDAQADSKGVLYSIELPTNLAVAQSMLDCFGDDPLGDVVKSTRDLAEINTRTIQNQPGVCEYISIWLVAWLHCQGVSLEEQVELSRHYGRLFVVQGKLFTFCLSMSGSRLPDPEVLR